MFKPVPNRVDYVALEHEVQRWWDETGALGKYLRRNQDAAERWSFIDGPITANNPMGVHHGWGRTYKDLYNRFWTMRGRKLRYQQGFDGQGLWIEVEVEREKGFRSKREIERFGVAEFVEACKERVMRFSREITRQSVRLGYWMDWDNSYQTLSDENNYTIWGFLKKCWQKGWLYKGKDTMPWCPACGTGMSQQEVTEGYQEITHRAVYLKFPLVERPGESLLVWTTTPWTLPANVAAAVNPELTYVKVRQGDEVVYVSRGALATAVRGAHEVVGEVMGSDLVGLTYRGPFDELPAQNGVVHRILAWDEVSDAEGTGVVHIAPGAGAEDFALSKDHGLDVIAPLEEDGTYTLGGGFGFLEGRFAGDVAEAVFESLAAKGLLYGVEDYTHRYPTCWRCGSELVFRLVDEWFIAMDELRHKIMDTARKVRWIPEFGLARELDWLRNMHDWMISKKRYYGLALPIYECQACGSFEVIGSETELRERAVAGWSVFEGHSPHRPWVDAVQIACRGCGARIERIKDVGNPWLDAGIVPFSTLNYRHDPGYWRQWFPADWVSESFPGQFRNWFYALLAMGTVMVLDTEHEGTPPFLTLFSYALLRDEHGEEMHKSKGNAIWFDDAAEAIGADVMRWLYLRANPASNLNFGFGIGDEIKRGFLSTLWNTYSFFVTYANIDGWTPASRPDPLSLRGEGETASPSALRERGPRDESVQPAARPSGRSRESRSAEGAAPLPGGVGSVPPSSLISEAEQRENDARPASPDGQLTELDRWALSELNQLVETCTRAFESYDSMTAARQIEEFVEALSNWYVRRSRRRFWKAESDADKQAAYETLWTCLATLNRLMAPMTPFLAEEMYQNLVRSWDANALESVHLCDWPAARQDLIDEELEASVRLVQRLSSLGRAARAKANLRVRQPLAAIYIRVQNQREGEVVRRLADQLLDELNVKSLDLIAEEGEYFDYQVLLNLPVLGRKYGARMAALQRAFAAADKASVARRKLDGAPVELDGFELQPDELLVSLAGRPGFAVAEDGGYAVAVTTEVTPELADEGLARELVRRIQEMRKSAGFEPADRIRLGYEGDHDVARVLREWGDYISHETLAEAIAPGAAGGYSEPHTIDGRRLKLSVERV